MDRLTQIHRLLIIFFLTGMIGLFTACTTPDVGGDNAEQADDFSGLEQASSSSGPEDSIESEIAGDAGSSSDAPAESGEFDEFSESTDQGQAASSGGPDIELAPTDSADQALSTPPPADDLSLGDPPPSDPLPATEPLSSDLPEPLPDSPIIAEAPAPLTPDEPEAAGSPTLEPAGDSPTEQPAVSEANSKEKPVSLTAIDYRSNDAGGTVVVEATGPMTYTTRTNDQTKQFIIEIPNSKLPRKLQRPFNTRDIAGLIGAIDAYQPKGSKTSRIVLQMREGAPEPVVQAEGKSLLIVAQGSFPALNAQASPPSDDEGGDEESPENMEAEAPAAQAGGIMSSDSLEQFLSTNQKFYGKRISVETDDADLRDVIKFISEEANVNLVLSSEVRGKISVKLKNVPWDQAVVTLLKANKLGYTRVGSVIRVAPLKEIKEEEDAALDRKQKGPQKVRTIAVNYSKVEDVEKQVKSVLSQKGTVVADTRTSTVVVSDFDENISKVEQLIRALDIPPSQVLIEGKIVEASDDFENQMGFAWSATGRPTPIGGPRAQLGFSLSPGFTKSTALFNLRMGTFDILGDLTSALALYENQGTVNILSSPRIVALHNEEAEINQKVQVPTTSVTDLPGGGQRLAVQYVDVKLRLFVKPQVTNDGSVIMNVDVNRDIQGPAPSGSVTGAPAINSKSAKSKVLVRNGQTAVIGGIYQNDDTKAETKIPGLADVPLIGWLFKSTTKTTRRNELLIFLTPRILARLDGATSPMESYSPPSAADSLAPPPSMDSGSSGDLSLPPSDGGDF